MSRVYTPWEYQRLGTEFLFDVPRAALWADMGMGKTVTTLTALDGFAIAGWNKPALIVAPKRVALNVWPVEARKWRHLQDFRVSPVIGTEAQRIAALRVRANAYSINFENLQWLFTYLASVNVDWPFGVVVIDEATRLKSMRPSVQESSKGTKYVRADGGKRARQLARIAHTAKVPRWINLTGTPAPNGLQDLWGQAWFQDAGQRLGRTFDAFKQRWFRPKWSGFGIEPMDFAQEQIEDRLRDVCLTTRAADYFDVREPKVTYRYVDLPDKARRQYREMEKELFTRIEEHDVEAFNAAAKSMKCLQLANGAAYVDDAGNWKEVHRAKLDELQSIVEEAAGKPLLVAYHFKSDLARIRKAFPQARVLDAKPQTEADWNAGKIPMLLAHPASAGHGLNLQDGGHILVYFSVNWDLELHAQIAERIGPVRQLQAGYDRVVYHYYILARDTIDEVVLARLQTKRDVQDLLLEAMRAR